MFIFIVVMKRCLITFIIFCSLFNNVFGQSPPAAIDSLIKYGVITVKERPTLEKELRDKYPASYRIMILGGLVNILIQKTYHIDPHRTGSMFSYGNSHPNKKIQDSINTSLHALLEKIKKSGLLTDRVYTYTKKGIDSGRYVAELQMLGSLTEMSSRLEWLAPNRLLPIANDLHKNGIVSDSSYVRLENDIKDGKIESASQLNDYCRLERTFDLASYPDDPNVWLEQLHSGIASIVPDLNFTDFSYIPIPDTSFSIPGIRFKVSLISNGRRYKYTSLPISNYKAKDGKITPKDIFVEDFYRIFNKVLIDQQSPYQLHSIMFNPGKSTNGNIRQSAIIALSRKQTEVFMKPTIFSYMTVSMDSYDNALTSQKIDSAIAGWKKIGLFAHLSNKEIVKALDAIDADDRYSTGRLLFNFPRVVYSLDSAFRDQASFTSMLSRLCQITHGAFNAVKINQKKIDGGIKLQYSFNSKIHSYVFKAADGWLDAKFPAFIKSLGRENNLLGSFYNLRYENAIIYLTKQQYDYAVKYKLLDFEMASLPRKSATQGRKH